MDMSFFDKPHDLNKSVKGRRDHRNKDYHQDEGSNDLRKKANRRDRPRQRQFEFDTEDDE